MANSGKIQLVIPMAGLGIRFSQSGYSIAKPLLPIHGQPMFLVVIANLLTDDVGKIVIVAQKSFRLKGMIDLIRRKTNREIDLIEIDYVTGGPADTVELARNFLAPELPVVTANSDQYVDSSMNPLYQQLFRLDVGGSILTMEDTDPKWSYVRQDASGIVSEVREKEVISNLATVGIYGFKSAHLMWQGFDAMRDDKGSVNGEYYVAPSYNYLIADQQRILTHDLGPIQSAMHGMGIPEDYENFLRNPVSRKAADRCQTIFDAT